MSENAENKALIRRVTRWIMLLVLSILLIWVYWSNTALETSEFQITSNRIPQGFDGLRIVQISDLHNTQFGENSEKLICQIMLAEPDIIVITGDMIDSRRTDVDCALDFARRIVQLCPVYYVNGNHEARVWEYEILKNGLEEAGVNVLENRIVEITQNQDHIFLLGVNDPSFQVNYLTGDSETVTETAISQLIEQSDGYTVLLAHRPELFELYAAWGIDLVFSGHTHGGQFRLPMIGGLLAPNQGFFPEYDAGMFSKEKTTMIVSRGVGNSICPIRFNNRPEIVAVELKSAK